MTSFIRARTHARTRARRVAAVGAVAAGALLLAACGSDDKSGSAAGGDFNDADVTFAQQMIPHHQQGLELAQLADGHAQDPEIKKLATAMKNDHDPEIRAMTGWLKAWGRPAGAEGMPGMDHSGPGMAMAGMTSPTDMRALSAKQGKEFDRAFATLMTAHYNGAIAMATAEQTGGKNADAKKLAETIVKNQPAEVREFQTIVNRL